MDVPEVGEFHFVVDSQTAVIFDLDDTLYKERQFQISGFRAVLRSAGVQEDEGLIRRMVALSDAGDDPLGMVSRLTGTEASPASLLEVYRSHQPTICLESGAEELLTRIQVLGGRLGLLTDGRSETQRNKIGVLGIAPMFQAVAISEELGSSKPALANYQRIHEQLGCPSQVLVVADNPSKDFVTPNRLGWTTVQVMDDGSNIHSQFGDRPAAYDAQHRVASLRDLLPTSLP